MKRRKPYGLENLTESFMDYFKIPTRKEIEGFLKKTEQSLAGLKLPTRKEFNDLTKRVEALEKAVKGRKRPPTKTARRAKKAKAAAKKTPASRVKPQVTDSDKVLKLLKQYRAGADVSKLKARTGFEDKKIRNIIFKLSKKGRIKRTGRGVYKAKG